MNNVRQLFQIRDILIIINQNPARLSNFTGTGTLDNNQAGAAFGTFGIISQLPVADYSIMGRVVSAAGGHNNPVFQLHFAHHSRLKKFGELCHAISF